MELRSLPREWPRPPLHAHTQELIAREMKRREESTAVQKIKWEDLEVITRRLHDPLTPCRSFVLTHWLYAGDDAPRRGLVRPRQDLQTYSDGEGEHLTRHVSRVANHV